MLLEKYVGLKGRQDMYNTRKKRYGYSQLFSGMILVVVEVVVVVVVVVVWRAVYVRT